MKNNWIGIIGNVGPEADEILQRYLRLEMQNKGALNDQDYLPMLVVKNPNISDRTAAIFHNSPSPSIGILETCRILENNDVYYAALPSNTSHYFFEEFQSQTDVYIVNLIDITSEYISKSGANKAGILCTTPTKQTGIYTKSFEKYSIKPIYPSDKVQKKYVQNAIYGTPYGKNHNERLSDGLKSGNKSETVTKISFAIEELIETYSCEHILLGCTEIPTIIEQIKEKFPNCNFIDPMHILSLKLIEIYQAVDKELKNSNCKITEFKNISEIKTTQDIAKYVAYKLTSLG